VLTVVVCITEDLDSSSENVKLDDLAGPNDVYHDKESTTIVEGEGQAERHSKGSSESDSPSDRRDDERLRSREETQERLGEARRRSGRDQRRRATRPK